jgi:diguanylate cyclase (GGDEF)-like protein
VDATLIENDQGHPLHVLAQVQDVTDRRRQEKTLRHIADHDELTGLLNRRSFRAALQRHLAAARRYGPGGALLMLDLDGFKTVNDTRGHTAGDALILACAEALQARVRESDLLARLGGDEFAVLLPTGGREEASTVALALLSAVRRVGEGVTVSIGIAVSDGERDADLDEALAAADRAMYAAKRAGGNRWQVHGEGVD